MTAPAFSAESLPWMTSCKMGRLARHRAHRGGGLGEILMGCAVDRYLQARRLVGACALPVDARHAKVQSFYEHCGFIACADAPKTLYLPLG